MTLPVTSELYREYRWPDGVAPIPGARLPKSGWGPGPWRHEPDKIQWVDETTGLDCLIVRAAPGHLCGYVGVPPGHPVHGRDWDELDVRVHGGPTFADRCDEDAPEYGGICHVPFPGRPADVWWVGFDCAHSGDLSPAVEAALRSFRPPLPHERYRTVEYVAGETVDLARQLAEMSP